MTGHTAIQAIEAHETTGRVGVERELHDALGPALAAVALRIDTAIGRVERDPVAARDALEAARQCVECAIGELRMIIRHSAPTPVAVARLGLAGAIHAHVAGLGGETHFSLNTPPLPALPEDIEHTAYRIVCEAVTNVIRHAGARHCRVALAGDRDRLELTVADDGVGIPTGASAGIGLASIRARAAALGGTALISSDEGGVTVVVRLPL